MRNDKVQRILSLFYRLIHGQTVYKPKEAIEYSVNERSIQRDIDDIRDYLEGHVDQFGLANTIVFDRTCKGYKLQKDSENNLSNGELLAICKILLDSRAFTKSSMTNILGKLIDASASSLDRNTVEELIRNEEFHYIEPRHGVEFFDELWLIGRAIRQHNLIEVEYFRTKDKTVVRRKIRPVSILFSEYYFYLVAFIDDPNVRSGFDIVNDPFPTIYRVDRIRSIVVLYEKFSVPYRSRFEEGEFRKRVQFMYGGTLQKVQFDYSGPDVDSILDRLPTAIVIKNDGNIHTLQAEVFGKGIDMWIKSQGNYISNVTYFSRNVRTICGRK